MNEMMEFSTLEGMNERLSVLPFNATFGSPSDGSPPVSRAIKEDLQSDSSDRTQRWRLATVHILVDHYQAVAKPQFFDDDSKVRPDPPNRVQLATQEVFSVANVVLAWTMEDSCPWEPSGSGSDVISYPDFRDSWN